MKTSSSIDSERELFFNEMSERLNDIVQAVEMVSIETSDSTWDLIKITPIGRQKELWGLLVFCEKSLHFYAHSTESPIMGMIRATSSRKPPVEQLLSFSSFTSWKAELIIKRTIFGKKNEKFAFLVHFTCDAVGELPKKEHVFIMRTQAHATDIVKKMQLLQKN